MLLADDGTQVNFPKSLLPNGVKAGDILSCSFVKDAEATAKVADQTRKLLAQLRETDPGGDIKV